MATVNLRGDISLLDEYNPDRPLRVMHGHSSKINCLEYDRNTHKIYTSDITAYTIEWNLEDGKTQSFEGEAHTNNIAKTSLLNGNLVTVAFDDKLKITSLQSREYGPSVDIDGQPVDVKTHDNTIYVLTHEKVITFDQNGGVVNSQDLTFQATCMAIHPSGTEIAIGGKDNTIHVFNKNGNQLSKKYDLGGNPGYITCLDYSPNGQYLGSGDSNREVRAWEGEKIKTKMWVFHSTMITCIQWSSDNVHVVTGSVDTKVIVWSLAKPLKRVVIDGAHQGGVTDVCWIDPVTVASVGDDCCLKTWTITHHQ